jgi:hypothetical protein
MTKQELLQRLREEDEVVLLELLGLTSTELVDKCLDEIDDNLEKLTRQYEEEL